jgi:hypothetical protein
MYVLGFRPACLAKAEKGTIIMAAGEDQAH